jgi:hypothetical protein
MDKTSTWKRCKAFLPGAQASRDTHAGKREGLHEARAQKDYRVRDVVLGLKSKKAA